MAEKVEDEKEKELLEFLPLLELLRGVAGPSDRDEDDRVPCLLALLHSTTHLKLNLSNQSNVKSSRAK